MKVNKTKTTWFANLNKCVWHLNLLRNYWMKMANSLSMANKTSITSMLSPESLKMLSTFLCFFFFLSCLLRSFVFKIWNLAYAFHLTWMFHSFSFPSSWEVAERFCKQLCHRRSSIYGLFFNILFICLLFRLCFIDAHSL